VGHAVLIGFALLLVSWLALLAVVVIARPGRDTLRTLPRLLPDTVRLIRGLARDRTIPRSARVPVWVLLAYLAMPIDLVPDFIPLIGYADDAILVAFVLRRLLRRAGPARVFEHWPGDRDALATLQRVLGLPSS
jgi:uncharacterized membrane protein YkvA (DUF1232 family)